MLECVGIGADFIPDSALALASVDAGLRWALESARGGQDYIVLFILISV